MDPVTHALLGGATARVALARPLGAAAWGPGLVGAMVPDLDGLARLSSDPLLWVELHRHFTHSLAFVPFGGFLAALPWWFRRSGRARPLAVYAAACAGIATHGPLDASTTYGTLLLWPFDPGRIGLSWISIIDPIFTLFLIIGVAAAAWRGSAGPAAVALLLCVAHLSMGAVQHHRALDVQRRIAAARGDERSRGDVFPTVGNRIVWRSLYLDGEELRMDRIRVPWFGAPSWSAVTSVLILREHAIGSPVEADPRALRDFRRLHWFSSGWVARAPDDPTLIGDARYSMSTDRFSPVWGIRLRPGETPPAEWIDRSRERNLDLPALWSEISGRDPALRPVPDP